MANKVLLVGINKYPGAALRGCVNDCRNMAEFLVAKKYFEVEDIRVLIDERATTKNILDRLNWFVTDMKPGDKCLFHYSGHGAQTAARADSGDVDKKLEIICPIDFDWSPEKMVTDKQFVDIFKKMPAGVIFNWFSDSCHSGDLTRDIAKLGCTPRSYPIPFDIEWRMSIANKMKIECQSKAMLNGVLDVGFISGCEDHQTSMDAVMDGNPCGAFTYYLIRTLIEYPDMPLRKIAGRVRRALRKGGFTQKPEAEGARREKPFLQ